MLVLSNTQLTGTIPTALSNLQKLEVFKVENCQLSGDGWQSLYQIPTLKVLGVAGNHDLTGTLDGIWNLAQLEELYLGETGVSGPLPEEMGQMTALWILKSPATALTGALPASLENLRKMQEFDLSLNQLGGPLPAIGNWVELKKLALIGSGECPLHRSRFSNRFLSRHNSLVRGRITCTSVDWHPP
jgi:hypothetical protein